MEQEHRTPQLQYHSAKKRIHQDRSEPEFFAENDPDYDLMFKKTKFIGLSGADFKIGPIFFTNGYSSFEEDPKMVEQYCNSNFQPVSVIEEENKKALEYTWQNRMDNQFYTDDKRYDYLSLMTFRKWLENKRKLIEHEMYFYKKQQKSYETKENTLEYYK